MEPYHLCGEGSLSRNTEACLGDDSGNLLADPHALPPSFPLVRGTPASALSSGKAFASAVAIVPAFVLPPFLLNTLVWLPPSLALPPQQALSAQHSVLALSFPPCTYHAGELILPPSSQGHTGCWQLSHLLDLCSESQASKSASLFSSQRRALWATKFRPVYLNLHRPSPSSWLSQSITSGCGLSPVIGFFFAFPS